MVSLEMMIKETAEITVFGEAIENAVEQIERCSRDAVMCALMADHHKGYSQPIGGVVAYEGRVSPSGVGYDIACGNKAVLFDVKAEELRSDLGRIMDELFSEISFGVGGVNKEEVDDELFDDDAWSLVGDFDPGLKELARVQLGTVGSGNHYVDVL